jgi:predicted nucleotidyltransferase
MSEYMRVILQKYVVEIQKVYGNVLNAIILYGSYARGDYRKDSDIDIMILVNLSDEEIIKSRSQISEITYDFNMEHETEIMPVVKSLEQFHYWLPVYPFYQNIVREGVNLYVA